MKIIKYKKNSNNKYTIILDDQRKYIFYEDVILKFNLLLKKEISNFDLEKMSEANLEYDVYYVALNSLRSKFRSTYELETLLKKKEYPSELIDTAIEKLTKQGYLNDRSFAKGFINNKIITTNYGPFRIIRELEKRKINSNIIEDEMILFSSELQIEKIKKIIDSKIKSNRNKGGLILKQKIVDDLKMNGYEYDIISTVISNYDFGNNKEIAKKEYDKLYKKYRKKYSGYELDKIIKEKLFLKGLYYEE